MARVHATAVRAVPTARAGQITVVAHVIEVEAFGDRPDFQFIGNTVRGGEPAVDVEMAVATLDA
jgi:hypothetical protein